MEQHDGKRCEDFVLRCGIRFGDNIDIVQYKEQERFPNSESKGNKLVYTGAVSGLDDGKTTYVFDASGHLVHMGYSWEFPHTFENERSVSHECIMTSVTLQQGITQKYGEFKYDYSITNRTLNQKAEGHEYTEVIRKACKFDTVRANDNWKLEEDTSCKAWIIQSVDGYIVIRLSKMHWGSFSGNHLLDLGYTFFSPNEFDALMKKAEEEYAAEKEEQQEKSNKFFNDL